MNSFDFFFVFLLPPSSLPTLFSPQVLGLGQPYSGHETKLRNYHQWLGSGAVPGGALVALVDAYDILLSPAFSEIPWRFTHFFQHPIVFAGERSLWPDDALEPLYAPPPGTTPPAVPRNLRVSKLLSPRSVSPWQRGVTCDF